jgi:hypothetical protein
MRIVRRLIKALMAEAACPHSGKRTVDCAGCQIDRSLAPSWPEDHVPFATTPPLERTSRENDDSRLDDGWRQAA